MAVLSRVHLYYVYVKYYSLNTLQEDIDLLSHVKTNSR